MTDISTRAEQAAPDEARGLLEELWLTIHGMLRPTDSNERIEAWRVFQRLLNINTPEAHLAAAMMLTVEGEEFLLSYSRMSVDMGGRNWRAQYSKHRANGRTPALALIAAIARSVE